MADMRTTAINPNAPIRRDQAPQMTATPRSPRMGMLADALMAARNFANRLQVPQGVPLIGGEGLGSLVLGRAPEELVEMSYGNMPMRINPYAGQTASFAPEMKPNRGAQVADLLSLAGVPGGGRTAAALVGGGMADFGGGAERALIGYHGTPHRFAPTPANPLGEFRASQIGTGEGAQAYGYGTYFAEAPGVAKGYRTALSSPSLSVQGQEIVPTPGSATDVAKAWLDDVYERGFFNSATSNPFDQAIRDVQNAPVPNKQEVISELQRLKESGATMAPGGSLYTVDIPDEMIGKMLDWDKPLSQQPKQVRDAIKKTDPGLFKSGPYSDRLASASAIQNRYPGRVIGDLFEQANKSTASTRYGKPADEMYGIDYWALALRRSENNPSKASEIIRQTGIPGIRYLDQGSRGAGDGTRNIVVFPGEEQNVKILSRE